MTRRDGSQMMQNVSKDIFMYTKYAPVHVDYSSGDLVIG